MLASAGSAPVDPINPVKVITQSGRLGAVRMTNTRTGVIVTGAFTADHRGWGSTEDLGYGATYRVSASARANSGPASERTFTVTTLSPAAQADAQFIPAPDLVGGSGVGIGQPLVVQFTHPVADRAAVQQRLHVTSNPPQPGAWYWMDNQHVHYRPAHFWSPGTTVHLSARVYGVNLGEGTYGAADHEATYHVHGSWIANANGTSDIMTIYHNGHAVKSMPISMGKGATPTHRGIHVISAKDRSVDMNSCSYGVCSGPQAYNVTEYWAERISNDGEFVHENPHSIAAQGNSNVSHGCINLNKSNAQWFFRHLGLGDVVEVSNSGGPPLPTWDTYGDWSLPWAQWQANNSQ